MMYDSSMGNVNKYVNIMSKEYTREEAIEKASSLIKKLSQRIEELSEITIGNCDNFEIALYLQKNGKEFTSLLEERDIKEELRDYDNETIAMVLGKILPVAIECGLEKEPGRSLQHC